MQTSRSGLFTPQEDDWAQWLNKQENWITARHTRPNANSQANASQRGKKPERIGYNCSNSGVISVLDASNCPSACNPTCKCLTIAGKLTHPLPFPSALAAGLRIGLFFPARVLSKTFPCLSDRSSVLSPVTLAPQLVTGIKPGWPPHNLMITAQLKELLNASICPCGFSIRDSHLV